MLVVFETRERASSVGEKTNHGDFDGCLFVIPMRMVGITKKDCPLNWSICNRISGRLYLLLEKRVMPNWFVQS